MNKFKRNFGVYVTLGLVGAGVGMFVGYYIESRRRAKEEDEKVLEEVEPIDAEVTAEIVLTDEPEEEVMDEVIVPVDPEDIELYEEEDVDYDPFSPGVDDYTAIQLAELHEKSGTVNYGGFSKKDLTDIPIMEQEVVIESRYRIIDLPNEEAYPEGTRLLVNPSNGVFYSDLGNGMVTPISSKNVFGEDDQEVRDMLVSLIGSTPTNVYAVEDEKTDLKYLIVRYKRNGL